MNKANEGELRRVLGPWSASALIAGSMIGTGIFFFVSDVATRLASPMAILGAWIVGAAVASCGALSIAELASTYPETGGTYVYLRRAYGQFVGFLYSWAEFLIMRPGSFGIMAVAFASYFIQFVELDLERLPWLARAAASLCHYGQFVGLELEPSSCIAKLVAIGAVVAVTVINIAGVRVGGSVQNVLTVIKLGCLVALIGVGAVFAMGLLEAHPVTIAPGEHKEGLPIWLFGAALIPVMWTMGGWDESPFVAEEVRNPERNLPLSILGGLWTVALLFVLVNAAYLAILSPAEIAGSEGVAATVAMQRALGGWAGKVVALAVMICAFGAANGLALTGGRIAYAAGRSQALFRWFGRTNPRTKTPVRSLVVQAVLTSVAIVVLEHPIKLLFFTGLAYWTFAGLMAAAVIVQRIRDPQRPRPFRVWGYPVVPGLFIAAAIGMGVSVVAADTGNALATVIILATGAVVYIVQLAIFGREESANDG